MFTLVPTHGNDYKNKYSVITAFDENEMFLLTGPRGEMFVNKQMLLSECGPGWNVYLLFNKQSEVTVAVVD